MLLYNSAISGNCYKVRLLFAKLGIEYERREVDVFDRSGRRELLGDYNPALRVPTLVFDDGRALGESGAILFHFGEGTDYVPADAFERAQVLQWMFFEQYSHEPNIAVVRFWAEAGIEPPAAELAAKRAGGEAALAAMERHLSDRRLAGAYPLDPRRHAAMVEFAATGDVPGGSRTEAEKRKALPINFIVSRPETGMGEIGDLVLLETGGGEPIHRQGIHFALRLLVAPPQRAFAQAAIK